MGSYGKITFVPSNPVKGDRVMAKVNFRDYDGERRPISKWGGSKAEAERRLKAAIAERVAPEQDSQIHPSTRVEKLADKWLAAQLARPDEELASNTKQLYTLAVKNYVKPGVGRLQIREVGTPAVDRALRLIAEKNGPGAAKTARAVFTGIFGLGVRQGALRANPVREVQPISAGPKKSPRALTEREEERLRDLLRSNQRAMDLDLPDLVEMMLATGVRIGEACAIGHYGCPDQEAEEPSLLIDDGNGTVEINGTMIRMKGAGLVIQHWPKTAAGHRVLAVPSYAVAMIEQRRANPQRDAPQGVVFGSPSGHLRDPNNTSGDLRQVLDGMECEVCQGAGRIAEPDERGERVMTEKGRPSFVRCEAGPWAWVTSHVFRKTVATRLEAAGLTPRAVADQLGHANPSMTMDVYFGRKVVTAEAARILDR